MDREQNKLKYIIFLILGIGIFTTYEVVCKTTVNYITSSQMTFYRFLIGGLCLLPVAINTLVKNHIKLTVKELLSFCLFGLLLVVLSMNLSQKGLYLSNASMTSIIFSSNPLMVTLFSIPILREKATKSKFIGIFIGIAGLVITCLHLMVGNKVDADFIKGILLIFLSMIIFAFYTVINKKCALKCGTFVTIAFTDIFGALFSIPIMIMRTEAGNPFSFDLMPILPQFLYISIIGTGIAYYFYNEALAHLNTSAGSMSFFIKPGLAAILSAVILKETISANIIVGIPVIILGVFIAIKKPFDKK